MQFPVPINKALPRPPRILGVTMWVLFVFLLAGIYGPWLLQPFVSPWGLVVDHMELRILLSLLYQPPSGAIYSSQTWFLGIWVVGLSACALLWRVSPRRRIARAISCFPLGILVIAPLAVPLKYGSYNTLESFEAPQGYEVNWLTQPESFLAGAVRRAQLRLIMGGCVVDFCEPRLLGWSQDNQLYYFIADRHSYCRRDEG